MAVLMDVLIRRGKFGHRDAQKEHHVVQSLEWCSCKPRNARDFQQPHQNLGEKLRTDTAPEPPEGTDPVDSLISDF